MKVFGFFSGIGGFELGFRFLNVVSVCEIDLFGSVILAKKFPEAFNLGDIRYLSGDSLVKISQLRAAGMGLLGKNLDYGANTCESSATLDRSGLSPKTSVTLGDRGCPSCGASFTNSDMPACHFECEPLTWARHTKDQESSLLPTPTASSYGSCRGGGSGRVGKWRKSLQGRGIGHPEDWERMMGFPLRWTDVGHWETPLFHNWPRYWQREYPSYQAQQRLLRKPPSDSTSPTPTTRTHTSTR